MSRRPRDQLFKRSDILRLIESAKQKGLHGYRIDILPDGRLSLIVGEQVQANESSNSEVENWITQHEHKS